MVCTLTEGDKARVVRVKDCEFEHTHDWREDILDKIHQVQCLNVQNGGHFARSCNRKHEACKKQDCKQFHTTLIHPPDKDKLDTATKLTKWNETKQEMTNGFINLPQGVRSLLPVVPVKIQSASLSGMW